MSLTPSPQGPKSEPCHLRSERIHAVDVAWNGIVVHMPPHYRAMPCPHLGDRLVELTPEEVFDLFKLGPQPLGCGLAPHDEALHRAGLCADMGEAQEIRGIGLAHSPPFPIFSRKASELNEPGLLGMQGESKPTHSLA